MYKKLVLIVCWSSTLCGILAEFSVGDLFDRLTILEIKLERITDPEKIKNVEREYGVVRKALTEYLQSLPHLQPNLDQLKTDLLEANVRLWEIEDLIRIKEAEACFDDEFISLARSVYHVNDDRCAIKRTINELTGSKLKEEKQYVQYKK